MNKQEQRIIEAARNVLLDWTDGNMLADISGNFLELEHAFNDYEKPSPTDFDWQSFRAEAAKDILCAMIELIEHEYSAIDKDYWCGYAVEWTDALVKKLKEKGA